MAGGMDVHKNRYVEEWAAARENLEKTFRFNRRTLTLATIFGIVVPYVTYRGIVAEFCLLNNLNMALDIGEADNWHKAGILSVRDKDGARLERGNLRPPCSAFGSSVVHDKGDIGSNISREVSD